MGGRSVHRTPVPNDARGMALVVALLVMGLLTLLGATFLTISSTEHTIAANEVGVAKAFNIAEAGLERAKARIKTGTETNLDAFLSGGNPGPNLFTDVPFDDGKYSVVIEDDVDTGNNPNDDTNDRVFIRSTGSLANNPARKQILALVRVVKAPPVPTPRAAAEDLGGSGGSEFGASQGSSFDGRDWTPPANVGTCTDAGCGTLTGGTPTYGGFSNTSSSTAIDLGNGATMSGTGCVDGVTGTCPSYQNDTSISSNRWDSFVTAMIPRANQVVNVNQGNSDNFHGGPYTWGTQAAPQITVINAGADFEWHAQVSGAGILLIESAGNVIFKESALLNWQGLIIVRSLSDNQQVQFELANGSGRIRVFGVVVNKSQNPEIELHGSNKNFIRYSSAAMGMVSQSFGGTFTVLNWREVAL
jgi:hypothetical protein